MAAVRSQTWFSWFSLWATLVTFLSFSSPTLASQNITWIKYTGNDGTVWLNDDRKPGLYTQSFGDCQGDSLINVTRFDGAYYKDNMTVLFHLEGSSALTNESLMMYIGVFAYGESRFNLTFNPCNANIDSLCPLNSSVPISANGIIPVAQEDVANIPSIALTIPDFEGEAILRIFANSTQSQIACFSAVLTNGASFSHPSAVASVLGVFTVIALISSVAVTIYGRNVPETRKHYAHSISMFVVFSVYQHIFFTGALSMNWPSVLVAFWSNYAWSAGIIYSEKMQNSINKFIGSNTGNISMVGAAPNGVNANNLGGGYQISQIYKRATLLPFEPYEGTGATFRPTELEHVLQRRQSTNTTGYWWYGSPVKPGLPLPGNFSGFAGTLAEMNIPASNAFLTGLLWFLIFIACLIGAMFLLKWGIETLAAFHLVKTDRLTFFRKHWLWFTGAAVLRSCYVAFFMMMLLTMFQFTFGGATGVKAIAAVVFVIFLVGMLSACGYALWYRTKSERLPESPTQDAENNDDAEKSMHSAWYKFGGKRSHGDNNADGTARPQTWLQKHGLASNSGRVHVHDDEKYTTRFGWLSGRFRRSKWWFFLFWLIYELVRAAFYGGAAGHALTQVFGLLVWETLALVAIVLMRPFESNRLNLLMVYLLGFSKVATVALSSAFDSRFGLARIMTTAIGIVIIVIQGILTICLMIAILLGAISSYMSITRYRETIKPRSWLKPRTRYFAHIDHKDTDRPKPPPPPPPPEPETPKEPYFAVSTVRRQPKIEDEDVDHETQADHTARPSMDPGYERNNQSHASRAQSMRSRTSVSNLPYGARVHRTSWSTKDFQEMGMDQGSNRMHSRMSVESIHDAFNRSRAASLRAPSRNGTPLGGLDGSSTAPDPQVSRSRHGRRISAPPAPMRNSSIVNEE